MKMNSIKTIIIVLSVLLLLEASLVGASQNRAPGNREEKELESLYKKAKQSIYGKEWLKAMDQFRYILDTYPKSKQVAESLYWFSYSMKKRSEALENLDKILSLQKQALSHLEIIIIKFPNSNWVDDAKLLRVGIAEDLVKKGFTEYKKYILNGAAEEADMEMKLLALDSLLHMDKEKAFPILEKFVRKNKNAKLREKAIFVISQIQDPRVIPLLVEVVKTDANRKIREYAIFWLGQVRGPKGKDTVKELVEIYNILGDGADDFKLKEKIIFSLSQVRSDATVKQLVSIAKTDKNMKLREKAIFWIGQLNTKESLEMLFDIYKTTKEQKLKKKLIFSISQNHSDTAVKKLMEIARSDEDIEIREKTIFWLGQVHTKKKEIMRFFTSLYSSIDQFKLKEKIIFSIAQGGGDDGARELIKIYRQEKNTKLKKKIIFWMGQMRSKEAEKFIEKILLE